MICLFLGAGASFELGMPLVWEFTKEIKRNLTADLFRKKNAEWNRLQLGFNEESQEIFCSILENENFHYENMFGALETEIKRAKSRNTEISLYGIRTWFYERIYYLLYFRQINNREYSSKRINLYSGLKSFSSISSPLWIISLNHDVLLEMIALENKIPIKSGFNEVINLNFYNRNRILKSIKFEYLSRTDLIAKKLDFFRPGEYGINLIKLHGALDIFAQHDCLDLLKILHQENEKKSILETLKLVNEELSVKINGIGATNEIIYLDENKDMQFLRRTLLSGAHKFIDKDSQLAPIEFIEIFKNNLNYSSLIYSVGYSFSDLHVNKVFIEWLERNSERKLVIVDPTAKIPFGFDHLISQISLERIGATDFFIRHSEEEIRPSLIKKNRKFKLLLRLRKMEMLEKLFLFLLKKIESRISPL